MTQFLSITDTGGRIGRIRWSNSQDGRSYVLWWGSVSWDAWWPHRRPKVSKLAVLMAENANNATMAVRALLPSVEQATEAIRELGCTMSRQP